MKQTLKKVSALLLTIVMLCSLLGVAAFAAEPTVIATLDKTTITKSSDAQTVTLTIKPSEALTICNYGFKASIPTGWSIKTISNSDANAPLTGNDYNLKTGDVGWGSSDAEDYSVASFAEITYEIPANTAAGTYTINVTEVLCSKTYGTVNLIEDATASVTLTIAAPGASTGAEITGASSVTVGATTTLTAKLLPADSTETISSVAWSSSNDKVATVTGTGETATVNGVAAGDATITAKVTTSANKTHNATFNIKVTAVKNYTVKAEADKTRVYPNEDVVITVTVNDNMFDGAEAVLTYNKSLFTYKSASNDTIAKVSTGDGKVILQLNGSKVADGTALAKLTFTANEVTATTEGTFGFSSAKAGESTQAVKGNWPDASTVEAKVTVVKQFTVTFVQEDGTTAIKSVLVDQDGNVALADIPEAPAKEYYTFDKWYIGETGYTPADIANAAVTGDVTYKAGYKANEYDVELPADGSITGSAKATYGDDYEGSIKDFDNTRYDYKIEYTVEGSTEKGETKPGDDGKFTVPGVKITGRLTLELVRTLKGVTVKTIANYIDGWTLILVNGVANTNYAYASHPMYADAYTFEGKDYAFAYVVEGAVTDAEAGAAITIVDDHAGTVAKTCDVNNDGTIEFEDAHAAYAIAQKTVDVQNLAIDLLLRADVDRSGKVDGDDVTAVLKADGYTFA